MMMTMIRTSQNPRRTRRRRFAGVLECNVSEAAHFLLDRKRTASKRQRNQSRNRVTRRVNHAEEPDPVSLDNEVALCHLYFAKSRPRRGSKTTANVRLEEVPIAKVAPRRKKRPRLTKAAVVLAREASRVDLVLLHQPQLWWKTKRRTMIILASRTAKSVRLSRRNDPPGLQSHQQDTKRRREGENADEAIRFHLLPRNTRGRNGMSRLFRCRHPSTRREHSQ